MPNISVMHSEIYFLHPLMNSLGLLMTDFKSVSTQNVLVERGRSPHPPFHAKSPKSTHIEG